MEGPDYLNLPLDLKQRALLDTSKRAHAGIFLYLILWLVIGAVSGLVRSFPGWVLGNAAVMAVIALVRLRLNRNLPQLVRSHFPRAHNAFVVLTLFNALQWGLLTAASIEYAPFRIIETPMLLAACGIAAAGTTALTINALIRYLFPLLTILPAGMALLRHLNGIHVLIAVQVVVFLPYIVRATRVVHADYWNALRSQRLLEERAHELEVISTTDALTRLRNRLYFDAQFQIEWKRAFRHRCMLAVLLLDLDHFKRINDGYGHAFGYHCLREVARVLSAEVTRSGDVLARYGGEEFIVMLSDTDSEGAQVVAQRLLESVRGIVLEFGGERVSVSCSIGVAATMPVSADRGDRLINDADAALYQAKLAGRDRVVLFRKPDPAATGSAQQVVP
jgi:diguanylate cyclase (GGDEF)-like protein